MERAEAASGGVRVELVAPDENKIPSGLAEGGEELVPETRGVGKAEEVAVGDPFQGTSNLVEQSVMVGRVALFRRKAVEEVGLVEK